MFANLLNQDVTVIHISAGATKDAYGNKIPTRTPSDVRGCLQQVRRSEMRAGEVSDDRYQLYLLPEVVIATGDEVVIDGLYYEVFGTPEKVTRATTGQVHHIEATLRRTAGAEESS